MKFLISALLALVLVLMESASATSGCMLRPNKTRDTSPVQKPKNMLESATGRGCNESGQLALKYCTRKEGPCDLSTC
jgi:hypothetical protein